MSATGAHVLWCDSPSLGLVGAAKAIYLKIGRIEIVTFRVTLYRCPPRFLPALRPAHRLYFRLPPGGQVCQDPERNTLASVLRVCGDAALLTVRATAPRRAAAEPRCRKRGAASRCPSRRLAARAVVPGVWRAAVEHEVRRQRPGAGRARCAGGRRLAAMRRPLAHTRRAVVGALPGFGWWPIKAFRPCALLTESGKPYQRCEDGGGPHP